MSRPDSRGPVVTRSLGAQPGRRRERLYLVSAGGNCWAEWPHTGQPWAAKFRLSGVNRNAHPSASEGMKGLLSGKMDAGLRAICSPLALGHKYV